MVEKGSGCENILAQHMRLKTYIIGILFSVCTISIMYFLTKYNKEKYIWWIIAGTVIVPLIMYVVIMYKLCKLDLNTLKQQST